MSASRENRWPPPGRNRWPLTTDPYRAGQGVRSSPRRSRPAALRPGRKKRLNRDRRPTTDVSLQRAPGPHRPTRYCCRPTASVRVTRPLTRVTDDSGSARRSRADACIALAEQASEEASPAPLVPVPCEHDPEGPPRVLQAGDRSSAVGAAGARRVSAGLHGTEERDARCRFSAEWQRRPERFADDQRLSVRARTQDSLRISDGAEVASREFGHDHQAKPRRAARGGISRSARPRS
jgi:hypothetical protein